jgi:uncharacterized SAM-binding protein YcdF (DUF218 family)
MTHLKKTNRGEKWVFALLGVIMGCILLAALVLALRVPLLTRLGQFLVVNDELTPVDIIFVLNGDYSTRPFFAADLYGHDLAPKVVIARSENLPPAELGILPNETDISVSIMEQLGVQAGNIVILPFPGGVTSTFDEAGVLREYAAAAHIQRVILVTSAFHTRRVFWIFNKELAGMDIAIEMAAAPYRDFNAGNWWQSEDGMITLLNEYIKLTYYFFKYR